MQETGTTSDEKPESAPNLAPLRPQMFSFQNAPVRNLPVAKVAPQLRPEVPLPKCVIGCYEGEETILLPDRYVGQLQKPLKYGWIRTIQGQVLVVNSNLEYKDSMQQGLQPADSCFFVQTEIEAYTRRYCMMIINLKLPPLKIRELLTPDFVPVIHYVPNSNRVLSKHPRRKSSLLAGKPNLSFMSQRIHG